MPLLRAGEWAQGFLYDTVSSGLVDLEIHAPREQYVAKEPPAPCLAPAADALRFMKAERQAARLALPPRDQHAAQGIGSHAEPLLGRCQCQQGDGFFGTCVHGSLRDPDHQDAFGRKRH